MDCAPVYPWNFVRTNTIFGVVHAAGGYTAWSDKHPLVLFRLRPGQRHERGRLLFARDQFDSGGPSSVKRWAGTIAIRCPTRPP